MNDHRGTGPNPDDVRAFFYDPRGNIQPLVRAIATRVLDPGKRRHDGLFFTEEDVEDVVQEACLAVLEALERTAIETLETYAKRVLRNTLMDRLRAARPTVSLDEPIEAEDGSETTRLELLEDPIPSWASLPLRLQLKVVEQSFPEGKQRRAAQLFILHGYRAEETLDAMLADDPGCKRGAARERLRAVRATLRQVLGE